MRKTKITVHPSYRIGTVSPRLFGAFLEPIGHMVNGSIYNPKHPSADKNGMRQDFAGALKQAGLPAVRLPGGNFVSGWSWKDSIGPMNERKTCLDLAWKQFIPNTVGHDEYLQWAELAGAEAMYTVNLGTGSLKDAQELVEYTNFEGGTYWSDLRKKNGHEKPYGVKTWYLGNEPDGPWQIASWEKDPAGYGILAHEVSKVIKFTDPAAETAACVSSSPFLSHYPDWELAALSQCYETVDYISMHHYHSAPPDNIPGLLAGYLAFEDYIRTETALCDLIKTKLRSSKTMMLSFDEYGSSFRPAGKVKYGMNGRIPADSFCSFDPAQKFVRHDPDDWTDTGMRRPRMNEILQALATGTVLLTLLRHADRIKIGCATGGLACLCMTDREHIWKGASYWPFEQMIRLCSSGTSLQAVTECEKYSVEGYAIDDMNQYSGFDNAAYTQTAAVLSRDEDELYIFALSADTVGAQEIEIDARAFDRYTFAEHISLYASSPEDRNTYDNENVLIPRSIDTAVCTGGVVSSVLPPLSWNLFRFARQR